VDEATRKHTLEVARALERQGDVDGAVRAFVRAGGVGEAARVLVGARRFGEAARMWMQSLGVGAHDVGALNAQGRAVAQRAAVCFSQAGETEAAVEIFLALGDRLRAAQLLERAGDVVGAARLRSPPADRGGAGKLAQAQRLEAAGQRDAALSLYVEAQDFESAGRLARQAGRSVEAARYFTEAGRFLDAAVCFHQAGDEEKTLDSLVRVPKDDPDYVRAAVHAVQCASRLNRLDFGIDQFFGPFLRRAPRTKDEESAFYELGKLYEEHSLFENAIEAFSRLEAARPGFRDAAERLARLRGGGAMDALPDLPPLPDLEPSRGAAPPAATLATPIELSAVADSTADLPPPIAARARTGNIIAGRFRLEALLGQGGMATVYRALDLELGEEVALKLMTAPDVDPQSLARFRQEVAITRRLAHPNIVRIYDIGDHDGQRFITMELVRGEPLGSIIDGRPLEPARAIALLIQACAGLQAAHELGVVHRDIKPDNLLVTADGTLKVMDFGIAKHRAGAPGVTVQGYVAGTPAYISPEQVSGFTSVTARSDIYSLGITAYEMLTGRVPFEHPELMPLLMMHLQTPPPPLRARNPLLPATLDALILMTLEKAPERRIQSCGELAARLRDVQRELGGSA
jgi:serine/threonine-protein kinase